MTKLKGQISVKAACIKSFERAANTFSAMQFCDEVRAWTWRPKLMDSTILRRLREIRAENAGFNYRCIDNEKAIYQKIEVK